VENIPGAEDARRPLTAPRPGHADLAGAMKFNFHDARYILEARVGTGDRGARGQRGRSRSCFCGNSTAPC